MKRAYIGPIFAYIRNPWPKRDGCPAGVFAKRSTLERLGNQ
jgi:hypothetical protein